MLAQGKVGADECADCPVMGDCERSFFMNPPGYEQNEYATHPEYAHIIGVFRDPAQATEAINELKTSFAEDHIRFTRYEPQVSDEAEQERLLAADRRFFVHVDAPGEEEKAVNILAHHGANNSDLPRGTELVKGQLVYSHTAASPEESGAASALSTDVLDSTRNRIDESGYRH
jgi:hypothetical protein